MLVLSRKKSQTIQFLESGITVTVVEIRGDKVRLGIDAPATETVARTELLEKFGAENFKKGRRAQ